MTASPIEPIELLSIRDVQHLYGVSRKFVLNRIEDGSLPALRLGGKLIRFRPEDVRNLLQPDQKARA